MVDKQEIVDRGMIALKAGVEAIPVVGGTLATLIWDNLDLSKMKAVKVATDNLQRQLKSMESRIDLNAVNRDDFPDLFNAYYRTIAHTTHEIKLRAASSVLVNFLLREGDSDKMSYEHLDHFIRCVDTLSLGAIEVLGATLDFVKAKMGQADLNPNTIQVGTLREHYIKKKGIASFDPHLFMGLIGELNSVNLLHVPSLPPIKISSTYDNYPVNLTPLGVAFVKHLIES